MGDEERMMHEDEQRYYDSEPDLQVGRGGQFQYEGATGERSARSGRPAGERRSRGVTTAPRTGMDSLRNALGSVGSAVVGVFGGLADRARVFSAGRAQGRTQIEAEDYLGVGAPCRLCGNPVDHLQAVCPHCGARVRPLQRQVSFWVTVAIIVVLIVALTMSIGSCKEHQTGDLGTTIVGAEITTAEALQTAINEAQTILNDQIASHGYTRLSAFKLQQAIDTANGVLASSNVNSQAISGAAKALSEAVVGLVRVVDTSGYDWPYVADFAASMDSYLGKQIALTGTIASVDVPDDGSLGWSQITLENGSTLGIGVYSADCSGQLVEGKQATVYGVLNSDGAAYAFWADRVDVF